jgi:hypothetical protein
MALAPAFGPPDTPSVEPTAAAKPKKRRKQ